MIKSRELSDPNSCMNKAYEDEPVFVLLARDISAPVAIAYWAEHRIQHGKNQYGDPQIQEALNLARQMMEWRADMETISGK